MIVPVDDEPSPQLIVAEKAVAGSTPLAWVKLTPDGNKELKVKVRFWDEEFPGMVFCVVKEAGVIAPSAIEVVALPLAFAALVLLAVALLVVLPSSMAWAVNVS